MKVLTEQGLILIRLCSWFAECVDPCSSTEGTPECPLGWEGYISRNSLVAIGRGLDIEDKKTQESCHWEVFR